MEEPFDSSDDETDLLISTLARRQQRPPPVGVRSKETKDSVSSRFGDNDENTKKEVGDSSPVGTDEMEIDADDGAEFDPSVAIALEVSDEGSFRSQTEGTKVMSLYEVSKDGTLTPLNMEEPPTLIALSAPTRKKPEFPPFFASTVNKGRSCVIDLEEASPIRRTIPETERYGDPNTVVVKARKRLPKFVADSRAVLFSNKWLQNVILKLTGGERSISPRRETTSAMLEGNIHNIEEDPSSVFLIVRGRKDLLEQLMRIIETKMNLETLKHNLPALVKDGSNLELDFRFDCSSLDSSIGEVCHSQSSSRSVRQQLGVWVSRAVSGSQMHLALGRAIATGCAILSVGKVKIYEPDDIKEAWEKARESGKTSVVVTFCVSKNADLSEIDASRLVDMTKPRRRDGAVYHGRWNFGSSSVPVQSNIKPAARESASEQIPKKKRKAEENARKETVAATRRKITSEGEQHAVAYTAFATKYQPLKEIEYKPVGIKGQFVNKCMWDRHKEIYGIDCGDQCPCPSDLPRLTETVIPEYFKRMDTANRSWSNPHELNPDESPSGFASYFAPKFYGRIKDEYPNQNHSQWLRILFRMWELHKRQQRFGLQCKRSCPCGEGWDFFIKGTQERNVESKAAALALPESRQSSDSIGRPRSVKSPFAHSIGGADTPGRVQTLHTNLSRVSNVNSKTGKTGSLLRQMKTPSQLQTGVTDFSITFRVSEPLGFFVVSEERMEHGEMKSFCKITSVSPKADPKLKVGTIIVGTATWSIDAPKKAMEPVSTHLAFKNIYDELRSKNDGSKLRIWFDSSHVTDLGRSSKRGNEWSSSGAWLGERENGWAGGAPFAQNLVEKMPKDESRVSGKTEGCESSLQEEQKVLIAGGGKEINNIPALTHQRYDSSSTTNDKTHKSSSKTQDTREEFLLAKRASLVKQIRAHNKEAVLLVGPNTTESSSQANKGPGPSLLKTSDKKGLKQKHRRVSFSREQPETKLFIKDSDLLELDMDVFSNDLPGPTEEQIPNTVTPGNGAAVDTDATQGRNDELTKAILEGDYKDVVHQLKNGAHAQQQDSKRKLPRQYTKDRLEQIGNELRDMRSRNREGLYLIENDLRLKDKVLKIFLQAEHILKMAKHLQDWVRVEILPQRAKNVRLTQRGASHPSSDFLFSVVKICGRAQEPSMPLIPFSDSPDWSSVQNCPKHFIEYNREMDITYKMDRIVKVEVVKGRSMDNDNIKLGTWEETFETIKDVLDSSDESEISHKLINTEFLALGASLSVKFHQTPVDSESVRRKQGEGSKELGVLLDWIENFRKETDSSVIDANISLPSVGGLSLLHAAVYFADLKLVHRLLSLGADPILSSNDAGTAENLAGNLARDSSRVGDMYSRLLEIANVLKQGIARRKQNPSQKLAGDMISSIGTGSMANAVLNGQSNEGTPVDKKRGSDQLESSQVRSSLAERQFDLASPTYPKPPASITNGQQQGQQSTSNVTSQQQLGHVLSDCQQVTPLLIPPGNVGQSGASSSAHMHRLPQIAAIDWIQGKSVRCTDFSYRGKCFLGRNCGNAHVHPSFGVALDSGDWPDNIVLQFDNALIWSAKNVIMNSLAASAAGKQWHTCAYFDPEVNIIYYAERGRSSFLSEQGIYWYPNETAAFVACKRVVIFASMARSNANCTKAEIPTPPSPLLPTLQSAGYLDSHNVSLPAMNGTTSFFAVFEKLKKADMQAIYNKIFPGNTLPRSVWKFTRKDGLVSISFHSPAKEEKGAVYHSVSCNGMHANGLYWYTDEKHAKASAFLQFLLKNAHKGLVKQDLTATKEGKTFFNN